MTGAYLEGIFAQRAAGCRRLDPPSLPPLCPLHPPAVPALLLRFTFFCSPIKLGFIFSFLALLTPSVSHSHFVSIKMLNLISFQINLPIALLFIVVPTQLSVFSASVNNCPCQNYGTESSCTKVFENRDFLCQSVVLRSEALKCAKTCQMCCERPEFKCNNKKDETTCQWWADQGWCIAQQNVMANFCPNKCGLCNSFTRQQGNECRNRDETFCNKMTPNDCASEDALVRYKMHNKCPKWCGSC